MDATTTWELRGGIDPEPLRAAEAERTQARQEKNRKRTQECKRELEQQEAAAQERIEPFRRRLAQILGADVPEESIVLTRVYPGFEPRCPIARIDQTTESASSYSSYTREVRVYPSRILTAVWTEDEQIHIHVTGEPGTRLERIPASPAKTWNAGPVESTQDLLRIIEYRGNTEWTPPSSSEPAPEPVPESEPRCAADQARTLLEQLATNPRNQRGLRGALLALAWSNLATTPAPQQPTN